VTDRTPIPLLPRRWLQEQSSEIKDKENNYRITNREIDMEEIKKTMTLEEALGLVEEVKNCSLPWDDAHYEALSIIVEYVKKQITIAPTV
jgi:hypothetical protein